MLSHRGSIAGRYPYRLNETEVPTPPPEPDGRRALHRLDVILVDRVWLAGAPLLLVSLPRRPQQ